MQLRSQWQWRKTNKQVYLRFWGSIIKSPWVVDVKTNPGTINRMCERYISLGFEHSCFFVLSQYNQKKLLQLGLYSHLQWLLKFNVRDKLAYAKFSFKHWSSLTCLKAFWKLINHIINPLRFYRVSGSVWTWVVFFRWLQASSRHLIPLLRPLNLNHGGRLSWSMWRETDLVIKTVD